ncbi:hypothetical protein [Blastococcus sp. SYSU DS0539]
MNSSDPAPDVNLAAYLRWLHQEHRDLGTALSRVAWWTEGAYPKSDELVDTALSLVKATLSKDPDVAAAGPYLVRLKGSWYNGLAIPECSDIDVDVHHLGTPNAHLPKWFGHKELRPEEWRAIVARSLSAHVRDVTVGSVAITINSLDEVSVDVVPSTPIWVPQSPHIGAQMMLDSSWLKKSDAIRVWDQSHNHWVVNWPTRHLAATEEMDTRTHGWYRRLIRALKGAQLDANTVVDFIVPIEGNPDHSSYDHELREMFHRYPSYLVESLVLGCVDSVYQDIEGWKRHSREVTIQRAMSRLVDELVALTGDDDALSRLWVPGMEGEQPVFEERRSMFERSPQWTFEDARNFGEMMRLYMDWVVSHWEFTPYTPWPGE